MQRNAALNVLQVRVFHRKCRYIIAKFGSYYVRGVDLPFIDSGLLVDTELKFHGHNRSIVGKSPGMSVAY